jgi:hypothetical protein
LRDQVRRARLGVDEVRKLCGVLGIEDLGARFTRKSLAATVAAWQLGRVDIHDTRGVSMCHHCSFGGWLLQWPTEVSNLALPGAAAASQVRVYGPHLLEHTGVL